MKMMCIEGGLPGLTVGRIYDVEQGVNPRWAEVLNDNGSVEQYLLRRFIAETERNATPVADGQTPNALRFNAGKPELHYADMFPLALAEVSRTLSYGTQRKRSPYPRFNWCKGAPFLELYNCARRHMVAWLKGEKNDKQASEDGWEINNLAFTCGNLLRLLEQELAARADLDDRYKEEK